MKEDSIYHYCAFLINGDPIDFTQFKGKVMLIVNTASECGFTPQYEELQQLYEKYKNDGLVVLGFPSNQFGNQEPGTDQEIDSFCYFKYNITFPLFEKVNVNGKNQHPLFEFLKKQQPGLLFKNIKWNFTKFLVTRSGEVIDRYSPTTSPMKIEGRIQELLAN